MKYASHISIKTKMALAVALTLWASAFVGIRAGLQSYSPGGLALLRFLIASICMLFFYLRLPKRNITRKNIYKLLFVGAIGLGVYNVTLNQGELTVASGIAGFIISLSPIVTAVCSVFLLNERLGLFGVSGMIVSLLGVALIMLGETTEYQFDTGVLYLLAAALVCGMYSVMQKPFLKKYHAIEVAAFSIWGCTLALLFFLPNVFHEVQHASFAATTWVIYLGIFPAAIANIAWSYALSEMPATRAVNFFYFMPIIATILGWLCLGEVPAWISLAGGLVALLGVWMVNESYRRQPVLLEGGTL